MSKDRIYLSAPMTGILDYNFPHLNEVAAELRSNGWDVFNPAESFAGDTDMDWHTYMTYDFDVIAADCVAVMALDGWDSSVGASLEVAYALARGLAVINEDFEPIFDGMDERDAVADVFTAYAVTAAEKSGFMLLEQDEVLHITNVIAEQARDITELNLECDRLCELLFEAGIEDKALVDTIDKLSARMRAMNVHHADLQHALDTAVDERNQAASDEDDAQGVIAYLKDALSESEDRRLDDDRRQQVEPQSQWDSKALLPEADRLVSTDRGKQYGHPFTDFSKVGAKWAVTLGLPAPIHPALVGLCMIDLKTVRASNIELIKPDSILDVAGYAKTIAMVMERITHPLLLVNADAAA